MVRNKEPAGSSGAGAELGGVVLVSGGQRNLAVMGIVRNYKPTTN